MLDWNQDNIYICLILIIWEKMEQLHIKENKQMERGSAYIEFIFVLPILFVIACWSTELINQIRYFNSAISMSKAAAEYVSRDCSTEIALQTTDCIEIIPRELNQIAELISPGSHVAIRVNYIGRDNRPHVFDISERLSQNSGDAYEYPDADNNRSFRCVSLGSPNLLNKNFNNRNYPNLNSLVIAESYIHYTPIVPYIPMFWMSNDKGNSGMNAGPNGGNDFFICDITVQ